MFHFRRGLCICLVSLGERYELKRCLGRSGEVVYWIF